MKFERKEQNNRWNSVEEKTKFGAKLRLDENKMISGKR